MIPDFFSVLGSLFNDIWPKDSTTKNSPSRPKPIVVNDGFGQSKLQRKTGLDDVLVPVHLGSKPPEMDGDLFFTARETLSKVLRCRMWLRRVIYMGMDAVRGGGGGVLSPC